MKLTTYALFLFCLYSSQVLAEHRCEGIYELADNSSSECLETITVQHKLIEYGFEAIIIATDEIKNKDELTFEEMLSENVLASDMKVSTNQGWNTEGGFWINGGHYTVIDIKQGLRQYRQTNCSRGKLEFVTTYPRDYSLFFGNPPSQTCNYIKVK